MSITEKEAMSLVTKEVSDRTVKKVRENDTAYGFLCENDDLIPSKLIVAVNKTNGKLGFSIKSSEEAFSNCTK